MATVKCSSLTTTYLYMEILTKNNESQILNHLCATDHIYSSNPISYFKTYLITLTLVLIKSNAPWSQFWVLASKFSQRFFLQWSFVDITMWSWNRLMMTERKSNRVTFIHVIFIRIKFNCGLNHYFLADAAAAKTMWWKMLGKPLWV